MIFGFQCFVAVFLCVLLCCCCLLAEDADARCEGIDDNGGKASLSILLNKWVITGGGGVIGLLIYLDNILYERIRR